MIDIGSGLYSIQLYLVSVGIVSVGKQSAANARGESYNGHFLHTLSTFAHGSEGDFAIPWSLTHRRLCNSHGSESLTWPRYITSTHLLKTSLISYRIPCVCENVCTEGNECDTGYCESVRVGDVWKMYTS